MDITTHHNSLLVKHFGPITSGYEGDAILLKPLTVFIGPSGSGKSAVAKLYSTLVWLEKAISVGKVSEEEAGNYDFFLEKLAYFGIDDYITRHTVIEYTGLLVELKLQSNTINVNVKLNQSASYANSLPKVNYTPAERSLVSSLESPENVKGLPGPLFDFLIEFNNARKTTFKNPVETLVNKTHYEFNDDNKTGYITGHNFKITIDRASSGTQAIVPLLLVSSHLQNIKQVKGNNLSLSEVESLAKRYWELLQRSDLTRSHFDKSLPMIDGAATEAEIIELLTSPSMRPALDNLFKPKCFTHIIEEPELNLYPRTQAELLYKLIGSLNSSNQLVLTTHSPYLINAISLAIKAHNVAQQNPASQDQIKDIVPQSAWIHPDNTIMYQTHEDGSMTLLENFNGIPSDDNLLNTALDYSNHQFSQLHELGLGWKQ